MDVETTIQGGPKHAQPYETYPKEEVYWEGFNAGAELGRRAVRRYFARMSIWRFFKVRSILRRSEEYYGKPKS